MSLIGCFQILTNTRSNLKCWIYSIDICKDSWCDKSSRFKRRAQTKHPFEVLFFIGKFISLVSATAKSSPHKLRAVPYSVFDAAHIQKYLLIYSPFLFFVNRHLLQHSFITLSSLSMTMASYDCPFGYGLTWVQPSNSIYNACFVFIYILCVCFSSRYFWFGNMSLLWTVVVGKLENRRFTLSKWL